jgi:DNA-binding NarL/FixJ family response regulator
MIRVLIADDEPLIRAGIRTILESAGDIEVVAEVGTGRAAVDRAAVLGDSVDVALVDIRMPVLDGLSAAEELTKRDTRVVVLTSYGSQPNVARALRCGAAGFVLKNCSPDELIGAVRAAYAGDAYLSPAVTRTVLGMISPRSGDRDGHRDGHQEAQRRLKTLSPRELDVLRLVAEGLSNAEIGRRLRMTEPSIKTYVSRVLTKLDCANRVQAALLMRDLRG